MSESPSEILPFLFSEEQKGWKCRRCGQFHKAGTGNAFRKIRRWQDKICQGCEDVTIAQMQCLSLDHVGCGICPEHLDSPWICGCPGPYERIR